VRDVENPMSVKLYDVNRETQAGADAAIRAVAELATAILSLRKVGRHDDADELTRARHEVFRVICRVYGDGQ
jgi:hypothetical protein